MLNKPALEVPGTGSFSKQNGKTNGFFLRKRLRTVTVDHSEGLWPVVSRDTVCCFAAIIAPALREWECHRLSLFIVHYGQYGTKYSDIRVSQQWHASIHGVRSLERFCLNLPGINKRDHSK